ncbi:MFS transporter [Kitasatospora sp. NPDC057500]|uniref:MFS transporter n=1 Tax=Kitasatospora sp. NPDC057500 TaxID=3346151 RepID=UPI0036A4E7CB
MTDERVRDDGGAGGEQSGRRRWLAVAVLCVCVLVPFMDLIVVSVSLTAVERNLHATSGELQWIVAVYGITSASFMLVVPAVGGRWGYRRVLVWGLVLFGVASAATAFAPTAGSLIAMRVVMAIGASVVLPLSTGFITILFRESERGKAIGVWAAGVALATPLGAVLGGALVEYFWWGWIFLINVLSVALVLPLIFWVLPSAREMPRSGINVLSVVLLSAGGLLLVYGAIDAENGWGGAAFWMVAGVVVLVGFMVCEKRSAEPLIGLAPFRSARFLWAQATIVVGAFSLTAALFVVPMYLQSVLELPALAVGLRLIPFTLLVVVGSLAADRLSRRLGARWVVVGGSLVFGVGLALLTRASADSGDALVTCAFGLAGLGGGVAQAPAVSAALESLPPEVAANGSAFINALRNLGGALGVGIIGTVVTREYVRELSASGAELPAARADEVFASVANVAEAGDAMGASAGQSLHEHASSAFVQGLVPGMEIAAVAVLVVALLMCAPLRMLRDRPARDGADVESDAVEPDTEAAGARSA